MLPSTLKKNKARYLSYNEWRKSFFMENAPADANAVLNTLPWLLNVNHPKVPGYIRDMEYPFHVFGIENRMDILRIEPSLKRNFGMTNDWLTVRYPPRGEVIEAIYTIGSVGTISQTSHSDCDIWICIDRSAYSDDRFEKLNRKLNLIKGWLDERIRMPVYFFLTDVEDIRNCRFGHVDFESSGSAQKNILKEEFYRTSILICGKVPFWWVCHDKTQTLSYALEYEANQKSDIGEMDLIDLGDLERVDQSEFYGAAMWQLNKSLTHPLKSIIKMLLLKMFLETPGEELLSHRFRRQVMEADRVDGNLDPSLFTMYAVLEYFASRVREDYFDFIKKCFYLRYEMKLLSGTQRMKEEIASDVFRRYRIERDDIYALNDFAAWPLMQKIHFGGLMFEFMTDIYRDIVGIQKDINGQIDPQDSAIIGRKLSSSMDAKAFKVPVVHIPSENINLPVLTFAHHDGLWEVHSSDNPTHPIIANQDMIFCLTYLVWNGIFSPGQVRMLPNQTAVTLQEIINLGKALRDQFGAYDIAQVHFSQFLEDEAVTRMLVVISFEEADYTLDVRDIGVVYKNNWDELFVRRFPSLERLNQFLKRSQTMSVRMETQFYIKRNNKYYEKTIERAKNLIAQALIRKS